jgi:hypothetical protein
MEGACFSGGLKKHLKHRVGRHVPTTEFLEIFSDDATVFDQCCQLLANKFVKINQKNSDAAEKVRSAHISLSLRLLCKDFCKKIVTKKGKS